MVWMQDTQWANSRDEMLVVVLGKPQSARFVNENAIVSKSDVGSYPTTSTNLPSLVEGFFRIIDP